MEGLVCDIDTSKLDYKLQTELHKIGLLSTKAIILTEDNKFRKLGNFNKEEIQLLKTISAKNILPNGFKSANESKVFYENQWNNITLDCFTIDEQLGGGIPTRGITELSGESGVGKTQICLQLSITVQYPKENGGLGQSAVYICTEDRFPSKRLQQMVAHFPRKPLAKEIKNFTDRILVDHIADAAGLKECLFQRLPHLLKTNTVGLVILDSIAAIFRADYNPEQYVERANDMRSIGLQLHNLARTYGVAILTVNQVADSIGDEQTLPALGLVWANLVTTKLQVTANSDGFRTLKVLSAPHLPPSSVCFQITTKGVECNN